MICRGGSGGGCLDRDGAGLLLLGLLSLGGSVFVLLILDGCSFVVAASSVFSVSSAPSPFLSPSFSPLLCSELFFENQDFSSDDELFPERIKEQVGFFEDLPDHYGLIF
jgi:hypothetical protein